MNSLYQKYGVQTTDPSAGLMASTKATGEGLKEVVAGIKSLMENQEGQIIQRNTMQAQDILKQRIKSEGLGILANPIDPDDLTRQYGNMINKDAVGKTITQHIDLLKNTAMNGADVVGRNIFEETGSLGDARKGVQKFFIDNKMPSADAAAFSTKWATSNANLPVELEEFKTKLNESTTANVLNDLIKEPNKTITDITNKHIAAVPEKYQPIVRNALKEKIKQASALPEEEIARLNTVNAHFDTSLKGLETGHALKSQALKNRYEAATGVSEGATTFAKVLTAKGFDGVFGEMDKAADNNWVADIYNGGRELFGNWDDTSGTEAVKSFANNASRIARTYNISPERATAIAAQVFQERAVTDSAGRAGKVFSEKGIAESMDALAAKETANAGIHDEYLKALQQSNDELTAARNQILLKKQGYKDAAIRAVLTGQDYNTMTAFEQDGSRNQFNASPIDLTKPSHTPGTPLAAAGGKDALVLAKAGLDANGQPIPDPAAPAAPAVVTTPNPLALRRTGIVAQENADTRRKKSNENANKGLLWQALGKAQTAAAPTATASGEKTLTTKAAEVSGKPAKQDFGSLLDKEVTAYNSNPKNKDKPKLDPIVSRALWDYESDNSNNVKLPAKDKHGKNTLKYFGPMQMDRDFFTGPNAAHADTLEGHAKVNAQVIASKIDGLKQYNIPNTPVNQILAYNQGAEGLSLILKAVQNGTPMNRLPSNVQEGIRNNLKDYPSSQQTPATYLQVHTKKAQDALNRARTRNLKNAK